MTKQVDFEKYLKRPCKDFIEAVNNYSIKAEIASQADKEKEAAKALMLELSKKYIPEDEKIKKAILKFLDIELTIDNRETPRLDTKKAKKDFPILETSEYQTISKSVIVTVKKVIELLTL